MANLGGAGRRRQHGRRNAGRLAGPRASIRNQSRSSIRRSRNPSRTRAFASNQAPPAGTGRRRADPGGQAAGHGRRASRGRVALTGPDTVVGFSGGRPDDRDDAQGELGNAAAAVVRTMPNTPALVAPRHYGCLPERCGDAVAAKPRRWIAEGGRQGRVGRDEKLIDAVTAVSGSGPAYVFHLVEAMAAAGERAGLPSELAAVLARETVTGAGELLAQSELPPSRLRENVTSPRVPQLPRWKC